MALVIPITNERTCEGCTKCCDGWLIGEAYGHKFFEGKPCFWKGKKGCNIYDIRPYNPCVSFKCFWKYSDLVPKHFKPNNIGVIMVERFIEDIPYLNIHFGGQFVNNEVLDWCEKVYFLD